ncbi:hypothetical protein [Vibrio chagasii]|uniref:Uncharacterized protein n=1 Tax=Vibrio chagasii TaxID=170679 RepID=A0A7Y4DTM4_9VIBR|nr:hypothetical protein [Vibrio chagasii]NOH35636.1 hypothetical protein [Vibrio chagasii]
MEIEILQEIRQQLSSLQGDVEAIKQLHMPMMVAEPIMTKDEIIGFVENQRSAFISTIQPSCEMLKLNTRVSSSVTSLALEIAAIAINSMEFVQTFIYYSGDVRDIYIRVFKIDAVHQSDNHAPLLDEHIFLHSPRALKALLDVQQRLVEIIAKAHREKRKVLA